jgi:hypothetical protein
VIIEDQQERTADFMGDSGEGIVDAASKIEERMEEMQENQRNAKKRESDLDPATVRALELLRLTRIDLDRQLAATVHDARRHYLQTAIAEVDRRIDALKATI